MKDWGTNFFDIEKDKAFPYFCMGCLIGKNEVQMANDKYCHDCQAGLDKDPAYKSNDYWSYDGLIFFCDGKGYALNAKGKTVCLGNEADTRRFFETGETKSGEVEVLNEILDYRKEVSSGQSFKPVRAIRSVFARTLKRRATYTKQAASRKRLPVRTA